MKRECVIMVLNAFIVLLLLLPADVLAVPASTKLIVLKQPNGITFEARQWGDEKYHGWETREGYTIVLDDNLQSWTYAILGSEGKLETSSAQVAIDPLPQNISLHLRPNKEAMAINEHVMMPGRARVTGAPQEALISKGTAYIPVFLINFIDRTTSYYAQDFEDLLFGTGNGSMKDYYEEVSYGAFSVSSGPGGISGWYTASNTHDYYGSNNNLTEGLVKDQFPGTLVREAVAAADEEGFDFSPYDQNGDGYVDVVCIVYQGTKESQSGIETEIWPHQWSLNRAYYSGRSDGGEYITNDVCSANPSQFVKVDTYIIVSEILSDGGLSTIGVFAHEYGHVLGLPDLYDIDLSSYGVGRWSLMGEGCGNYRNRSGDSPAHLAAWSKYFLGWVTPTMVQGTLKDEPIELAETSSDVYQLLAGGPKPSPHGEYFLVENRQREGFDRALPGEGLLIWHIDESKATDDNSDNANECYSDGPPCYLDHYRVALVQADGYWNMEKNQGLGDGGDPYPGCMRKTVFSDTSHPNSRLYDGTNSNVTVITKSASGQTMTATLSIEEDTDPPSTPLALGIDVVLNQIALSWDASEDNFQVSGYKIYRNDVEIADTSATFHSDQLSDEGAFCYHISAYDASGNQSNNSEEVCINLLTDFFPMVAVGMNHIVGLKTDGTVLAVGSNSYGQLGVDTWTDIVQVAAGDRYSVGLKSNGTLVVVGEINSGQLQLDSWTNIIQIASGRDHMVGLKSDGTVLAVGWNNYGRCEIGTWANIIQVAAGMEHTVGLKSDGTIMAVGRNNYKQIEVDSWTDIKQVAAGWNHTVGIKYDGTVIAAGNNDYGRLEVNNWTDIIQVAAGDEHTIGLKSDGTVMAIGRNNYKQIEVNPWSGIIQVATGWHCTIGLKLDGTVIGVGTIGFGQNAFNDWDLNFGQAMDQDSDGFTQSQGDCHDGDNSIYPGAEEICGDGIDQDCSGSDLLCPEDIDDDGDGYTENQGDCNDEDASIHPGATEIPNNGIDEDCSGSEEIEVHTIQPMIASGWRYIVGLKYDGTVLAVGNNDYGQLEVDAWNDIIQVAAGCSHTVGLKSDGTVKAVGNKDSGRLEVFYWTNITQVTAGYNHTVGLKSDGTVVAVGDNDFGQLEVVSWSDIIQVAAGNGHTVGLKSDGTVVAVGYDAFNQLKVDAWTDIVQVATGCSHTVGLKSDGAVVAVGRNLWGENEITSWTDIIQVVAGTSITVGLKSDGTVVAAGYNAYVQLVVNAAWSDIIQVAIGTTVPPTQVASKTSNFTLIGLKSDGTVVAVGAVNVCSWTDLIQVNAGGFHTVGLKSDGTALALGKNFSEKNEVDTWDNITQVTAGDYSTVGLKSDGTVVAKGHNQFKQLEVGSWADIIQVADGYYYTAGLKSNGTVVAAGNSDKEQLEVEDWVGIIQVAAGEGHIVGLKSDGTVVAFGYGKRDSWTDIIQVAAGYTHTVGLKSDGTVVAVGINSYGQLEVSTWADIIQVAAESYHTVGIKSDGTVVAAGDNSYGQLEVSTWADIIQVAAEYSHTVGLKSDGTVVAVGINSFGQLEVSTWTDIIQVAAGSNHTVGLKSDGTVVAVGNNSYGQLEVSTWTDIIQVAAGGYHTVGLKSDGTVIALGANKYRVIVDFEANSWTDIVKVQAKDGHIVGIKSDGTVVAEGLDHLFLHTIDARTDIIQVAAGGYNTVGLKSDGTVVGVGNISGVLSVDAWRNIIQVAAGGKNTVGLKSDGTVVAAGDDDFGELEVDSWTDIIQVTAGDNHTVGLKSDGTVVAVGNNDCRQLEVITWTDIIQVAAGDSHTVGLKSDGTVVAVGDNRFGQCSLCDWDLIDEQATMDLDGDSFTRLQGDCNDNDNSIYPGAAEICGDGIDQDCDGSDLPCPEDIDDDGDGYTENQGDCNDGSTSIYPGATETCGDGIDQDCKGSDLICSQDFDDDSDGYTENQGDCNDANPSVHPDAQEIPGNGIDEDCNGEDLRCNDDVYTQDLEWVRQTGGDNGADIAVDNLGNTYITGRFTDTAIFGEGEINETTLINSGIFIAKYSTSGSLIWAKRAGDITGEVTGIAANSMGNIYLTGRFVNNPATFGAGEANQTTLISTGDYDLFVARYNNDGNFLWAKRAGGKSIEYASKIVADSQGNCIITGSFFYSAIFGEGDANETILSTSQASSDYKDLFLAKYDNNGNLVWAKREGGLGEKDHGYDVAVDSTGGIYLTGIFSGTTIFGKGGTNETTLLFSAGYQDMFIAKYNTGGGLVWAKSIRGTKVETPYGIAIDGSGNVFVTGSFSDYSSMTFGTGGVKETTLVSSIYLETFTAKYDSKGSFMWAKKPNGEHWDEAYAIAADCSGNSYVIGTFSCHQLYSSVTFGVTVHGSK